MNTKRIITSVLGLPIIILVLVFGNKYIVDVFFAIVAAICMHEYSKSLKTKANPVIWIGYVVSASIAFIHIIPQEQIVNIIAMSLPLIVIALFLQVIVTNMKNNIIDISVTFFGICYIIFFIMYLPFVYALPNGKFLVWYILCAAWGSDVFAYIIGKNFGKHKFSKISPNKTIEGCVAGIIGSAIFAAIFTLIFNTFFDMQFSYLVVLPIVAFLSIFGQLGDFAASSIKRYAEVKDFSNLIPGHGGMIDRVDSIIFIAPFAYFLFKFLLI